MRRPLRRDAAVRNRAWPVCLPAGDVLDLLCIVILRVGHTVVHGKAALRSHTDRPFLRVRFGTALLSGCRFWDVTHADEEHRRRPPQQKGARNISETETPTTLHRDDTGLRGGLHARATVAEMVATACAPPFGLLCRASHRSAAPVPVA